MANKRKAERIKPRPVEQFKKLEEPIVKHRMVETPTGQQRILKRPEQVICYGYFFG